MTTRFRWIPHARAVAIEAIATGPTRTAVLVLVEEVEGGAPGEPCGEGLSFYPPHGKFGLAYVHRSHRLLLAAGERFKSLDLAGERMSQLGDGGGVYAAQLLVPARRSIVIRNSEQDQRSVETLCLDWELRNTTFEGIAVIGKIVAIGYPEEGLLVVTGRATQWRAHDDAREIARYATIFTSRKR